MMDAETDEHDEENHICPYCFAEKHIQFMEGESVSVRGFPVVGFVHVAILRDNDGHYIAAMNLAGAGPMEVLATISNLADHLRKSTTVLEVPNATNDKPN